MGDFVTDTAINLVTLGSFRAIRTALKVMPQGVKKLLWSAGKTSQVRPIKQSMRGGVIRVDDVPSGSKLEYLAPGRIRFDGVEFRAVRELSHLSEAELRIIRQRGIAPRGIQGDTIHGHHYKQLSHRSSEGFVVEMPSSKHSYSNKVQHPKGKGSGLSDTARKDWENLRPKYHKERARTELLRRGLLDE